MTVYDYLILYFSIGSCMAIGLMLACAPNNAHPRKLALAFVAWPYVVFVVARFAIRARRGLP